MIGLFFAFFLLFPQEELKPLPDAGPFLAQVRKKLRSDRAILSQYTFTQKETTVHLDGDEKPKKTEVKVYEIFPGVHTWETYRRLISKDGVRLRQAEIEKQDREHKKKVESERRKLGKRSEMEAEKIRGKELREENEALDDVFRMYEMRLLRRERLGDYSTVVVSFRARPGYKPKTTDGKRLQNIAGTAWVNEEDHELVRLDAEVIKPISLGLGLLAKLHKGARVSAERHKFNNEVWLPVKSEAQVSARVLLVKGLKVRATTEYSEHKKYSVETVIKVPGDGS
ncbi:MAG: hypothetical protein HY646_11950 [Acidobacteria bacterium]|nr:hypothetical protein [Acidobacteriota bacterium]